MLANYMKSDESDMQESIKGGTQAVCGLTSMVYVLVSLNIIWEFSGILSVLFVSVLIHRYGSNN